MFIWMQNLLDFICLTMKFYNCHHASIGKIKEDIIYGICMPATGFSALFVLLALMTVVSVIVSGFICYHRQLAKVAEEAAPEPATARVATLPHGVVPIPLNQVTMKQTLIQHTMKV